MSSKGFSQYLYELGATNAQDKFLRKYISKFFGGNTSCGVLIDKALVNNDDMTHLTAIDNHNKIIGDGSSLMALQKARNTEKLKYNILELLYIFCSDS
jgi:hypothetical protein